MLPTNPFQGVREITLYTVYLYKASVNMGIAIVAKSCFPPILY